MTTRTDPGSASDPKSPLVFWLSTRPFTANFLYAPFPPPSHPPPPMSSVSSRSLRATPSARFHRSLPEHRCQTIPAFQRVFPGVREATQWVKLLVTGLNTRVWFLEPTGWKEKNYCPLISAHVPWYISLHTSHTHTIKKYL